MGEGEDAANDQPGPIVESFGFTLDPNDLIWNELIMRIVDPSNQIQLPHPAQTLSLYTTDIWER